LGKGERLDQKNTKIIASALRRGGANSEREEEKTCLEGKAGFSVERKRPRLYPEEVAVK